MTRRFGMIASPPALISAACALIDQQQAAVPGASVTAIQAETGARHETVSGDDGQYTFPFVLPGAYQITVEARGFKRHVREGVLSSASTGKIRQVVTAEQAANIPLAGRSSTFGQVLNQENLPRRIQMALRLSW